MIRIIPLGAILWNCFYTVAAERPKFRIDYRYEQAFDSFYKLHQTATSWEEARIRCQAEGAHLLVPSSLDEADAVPLLFTSVQTKYEGIFVGIHDLYSEKYLVTILGDKVLHSILNLLWEYEQPWHGEGRCTAMRRTGRMFLHDCHTPLPFICKVEGKNIQYYEECDTYDSRWKLGPNGTCYITHKELQTWYQAFGTCMSAGGYLAVVNDHAEAEYVRGLFKSVETRRMPMKDLAFLGFNDLFQRNQYRTVHGERVEDLYKDWDEKCPQKYNGTSTLRCGGMGRTGLLALGDCDVPTMFFCEKQVDKQKSLMREKHLTAVTQQEYDSSWN